MKAKFQLPQSPRCVLIYKRDGDTTNYKSPPIPTPKTNGSLEVAALGKGIALRWIQRVEALQA